MECAMQLVDHGPGTHKAAELRQAPRALLGCDTHAKSLMLHWALNCNVTPRQTRWARAWRMRMSFALTCPG